MEANPMITISPQSVNTTVGANATFTCAGINGLFVLWVINELVHNNVENINRGIKIRKENKDGMVYSYLLYTVQQTNNLVVKLTDPCLNYTFAVSAWNDAGQGYIKTLSFVLYQVITISPQSVNTTVGANATFTCAGINGLFVLWVINELVHNNVENINRGIKTHKENKDGMVYSYLTVPATPSNNNVSIKCALLSSTKSDGYTTPVTLLIQGKLEGVSDLDVSQLNSSSVLVSFTPPFTLQGVPIRNYSIEILSNTELFLYTIQQTNNLVVELTDPCLNYTFAISAWNDAGQGYIETLSFILYQVPDAPDNLTTSVVFPFVKSYAVPHVIIYSQFSLTKCVGKVPDYISIYQLDESLQPSSIVYSGSTSCVSNVTCSYNWSDLVEVAINISSYVSYGNHYLMAAKYSNMIGYSPISSEISIISDAALFTYQQQDGSSIVCLQCQLVSDPPLSIFPLGCKAVFIDNDNVIPNKSMIVPYNKQFNAVCDTSFLPSQYTVYVYDSSYLIDPVLSLNVTVSQYDNLQDVIATPTPTTYANSELSTSYHSGTLSTSIIYITTTTPTTTIIVITETSLSRSFHSTTNSINLIADTNSSTTAVIMSLVGSLCVLMGIITVLTILLGVSKIYYKQQLIAKVKQVQTHCHSLPTPPSQVSDHSTGPVYERIDNETSINSQTLSSFRTTRSQSDEGLEMTKCPAYTTPVSWQR